jgi:Ca2+-transporting ATPase
LTWINKTPGPRICDNIRKFVRYRLTANAGELWMLLSAPFLARSILLL